MPQPSVAIVILNWNGLKFLQQFLPSVMATRYSNYEVVVADNASTDESVSFLRLHHPSVRIIELPKNYGFARGYNEALAMVPADYFMILNSDVEVDPDWLRPLVDALNSDKMIGAAQPKLLAYHQRDHFEYAGAAGGWLDLYGYPFARGRVFDVTEKDEGQYDEAQEIFWATGAAMMVRAEVFASLGGFYSYLFAHQEEIDLCWRMHRAGYKVISCPASTAYHVGGGTLPKGNSKKTFLNFRNNQILMARNLTIGEAIWKIPYRLALDIVSGFRGLMKGDPGYFFAIFRAHLEFFSWLVFIKKPQNKLPRKPLKSLPGVYHGNVVFEHFARGKKKFSDIVLKVRAK